MKIVTDLDGMLCVTLSRKNLNGLYEQLNDNYGTREHSQIMKKIGDKIVIVSAEEDHVHYEGTLSGRSSESQKYGESHD